MIRSSKVSLKFANPGKRDALKGFLDEYRNLVSQFVDMLWDKDKVPILLPKDMTSKPETWLTARMAQCAGKQASGIVRGTRKKHGQRVWMAKKLRKDGQPRKAKKLERHIASNPVSKPCIGRINPELDSRFVTLDMDNETSFDGWLTLGSVGNRIKLKIPFKGTKHLSKLMRKGRLKNGIRVGARTLTLMVDIPDPPKKETGKVLGIDIGQNKILTCSDGQVIDRDPHGHDYRSICEKMARKRKGSKGFERAARHRSNFINWAINRLDLSDVAWVCREDIKLLNKGKRTARVMSHWNYAALIGRLDSKLESSGVQMTKIDPTYTSQRCSRCGWVRKGNRDRGEFSCDACGMATDADLNASVNLSLGLAPIGGKRRRERLNRRGFYWSAPGQEPIVPAAQEACVEHSSTQMSTIIR